MEDDGWSFGLSASSRSIRSTLKSQSEADFYIDLDDFDGDDDVKVDFPCPFCSDDFDIVELCYHIDDEHPAEYSGECPVCATRVDTNMVRHITTQHVNFIKGQHKLKHHKEYPTFSSSRKEWEDEHHLSIFPGSLSPASTSKMALDPLLSFLHKAPAADKLENVQSKLSPEVSLEEKSSDETLLERNNHPSPLSDKDQEERALKCKFVQGLLLSTILDDDS